MLNNLNNYNNQPYILLNLLMKELKFKIYKFI